MKILSFLFFCSALMAIPVIGNAKDISGVYRAKEATITVSKVTGDVWEIQCKDKINPQYPDTFLSLTPFSGKLEKWGLTYDCKPAKQINNRNVYRTSITKIKPHCPGFKHEMLGTFDDKYQTLDFYSRYGEGGHMSFDTNSLHLGMSMAQERTDKCRALSGEYKKVK